MHLCYLDLHVYFREVPVDYQGPHLKYTTEEGSGCRSDIGVATTRVAENNQGQNINLGSPHCRFVDRIIHETLKALGESLSSAIR